MRERLTDEQVAEGLRIAAEPIEFDPCPCCSGCAEPGAHSEDCTFASDCPTEWAALDRRWAWQRDLGLVSAAAVAIQERLTAENERGDEYQRRTAAWMQEADRLRERLQAAEAERDEARRDLALADQVVRDKSERIVSMGEMLSARDEQEANAVARARQQARREAFEEMLDLIHCHCDDATGEVRRDKCPDCLRLRAIAEGER